jgi:hypothetical protein
MFHNVEDMSTSGAFVSFFVASGFSRKMISRLKAEATRALGEESAL